MATLSSILAGRIPWAEAAGGLQSMGSQRVGHDRAHTHMQVSDGVAGALVPSSLPFSSA